MTINKPRNHDLELYTTRFLYHATEDIGQHDAGNGQLLGMQFYLYGHSSVADNCELSPPFYIFQQDNTILARTDNFRNAVKLYLNLPYIIHTPLGFLLSGLKINAKATPTTRAKEAKMNQHVCQSPSR